MKVSTRPEHGARAVKVSSRAEYGMRALVDLALHYGEGYVQSHDIAARQGLPESYLNQIMTTLRRAGLVTSKRGPAGGHTLSRSPDAITLRDIDLQRLGDDAVITGYVVR